MKLALVVLIASACADDGGPRLSQVSPAQAAVGASVELRGDRFCGAAGSCVGVAAKVAIGLDSPTVQAIVVAYSNTAATIQIPSPVPAGPTDLVMTVDGRSSNALAFEVLP